MPIMANMNMTRQNKTVSQMAKIPKQRPTDACYSKYDMIKQNKTLLQMIQMLKTKTE